MNYASIFSGAGGFDIGTLGTTTRVTNSRTDHDTACAVTVWCPTAPSGSAADSSNTTEDNQ